MHLFAEEKDTIPEIKYEQMANGFENMKKDLNKVYEENQKIFKQLQVEWKTKEDSLRAEIASLKTQIDAVKVNIGELSAGVDESPLAQKKKKEERKAYEKALKEEISQTREMLKLPWNEVSLDKLEALELKLRDKTLPNSLTSFHSTLLQAIEDKKLTEKVVAVCNGPVSPDSTKSLISKLFIRCKAWNKTQDEYGTYIGKRLNAHQLCWEAICGLSDKTVALKQENFHNAGDKRLARTDEGYDRDKAKIEKLFADFQTSTEYGYIQKYQLDYLDRLLKQYEKAALRNPYESTSLDESEIFTLLHEYVKK